MIKEKNDGLPEGEAALECLYKQLYPALFNFAHKLLHNREAAEDAVQEAFIRIIQRRKAWKSATHIRHACLQAVLHVCIDIKRKGAGGTVRLQAPDEQIVDGEYNALQNLLRLEVYEQVIKAVEELPPVRREVIRLSFFEDKPLEEVAGLMGKSYEATKALKHEAKQQLRRILLTRYHLRPELLQLLWLYFQFHR